MAAKKKKSNNLFLACNKCAHRNYRTSKTKQMQTQNLKLNLRKHCKFCRQTQFHKEGVIK